MTIPNTTDRLFYNGNDVTDAFDYTFLIYDADQLRVVQISALGVATVLEYVTDYAISGISDPAGGQVTLVAGALPTGQKLLIRRTTPGTQLTDIKNQTIFYGLTHEMEMDMLAIKDLEQQNQIDKCLQFPETETPATNNILPSISERKNKVLGFDSNGDIEMVTPGDVPSVGIPPAFFLTDPDWGIAGSNMLFQTCKIWFDGKVYDVDSDTLIPPGHAYILVGTFDEGTLTGILSFELTSLSLDSNQAVLGGGSGNDIFVIPALSVFNLSPP